MGISGGPDIINDSSLVLALDASDRNSYVSGSTTWFDVSGFGNNGTLTNGPTFSTGSGGAIVFDGTNDYVTGSINTLNDFSLTYTVYSTDISSQFIFYPAGLSFSGNAGGVFFGGNLAPFTSKTGIYDGSTQVTSNTTITTNTWYIITATRNGTTGSIYINGLLNATGTISSNSITAYNLGRRTDAIWYYKGNIANIQVYNRALSATEILQNYNALKSRFT